MTRLTPVHAEPIGVATEQLKIQCLGNVLAPTSWCSERVPDRIADVRGRAARLGAVQRA